MPTLPALRGPGVAEALVFPMDTLVMDPDAFCRTAEMAAQVDPGLAEALVSPRVITQQDPDAFCCTAELDTQVASPFPPDGAAPCGSAAPAARVVPELCIQGGFFSDELLAKAQVHSAIHCGPHPMHGLLLRSDVVRRKLVMLTLAVWHRCCLCSRDRHCSATRVGPSSGQAPQGRTQPRLGCVLGPIGGLLYRADQARRKLIFMVAFGWQRLCRRPKGAKAGTATCARASIRPRVPVQTSAAGVLVPRRPEALPVLPLRGALHRWVLLSFSLWAAGTSRG